MARTYTVRELIEAYLSRQKFSQAHADLVAFHGGRFSVLSRLFGLEENWTESVPTAPTAGGQSPMTRSDAGYLMGLFRDTAAIYNRGSSPFGGYLEAPRSIAALYQKFGRRISGAEDALHAALLDLMSDIFVSVFGKGNETFDSSHLLAMGFDDSREPDPIDYW